MFSKLAGCALLLVASANDIDQASLLSVQGQLKRGTIQKDVEEHWEARRRRRRKRPSLSCPFLGDFEDGSSVATAVKKTSTLTYDKDVPKRRDYYYALKKLDIEALIQEVKDLFTASQDYWPADYGHYGPFFIRLAWHCSGSFRASDGKGGCAGGRIRFEPERSWDDNTNLDKARALLYPIKKKYGKGLSWGDLYALAGTAAIQDMGGPTKPFCFGRFDDVNGEDSAVLGKPCKGEGGELLPNGKCISPWGTSTVGLIYVNPEGPVDDDGNPQPDPALSAKDVREVFGRMGHNDYSTVALIGGGHAFGKTHGACSDAGPGKNPADAIKEGSCEIWESTCNANAGPAGKGNNTVTSGFEGAWTTTPTEWSNEYFTALLGETWEVITGPGGKNQWQTADRSSAYAGTMRLTADMALKADPAFRTISQLFADDEDALNRAFAFAWDALTTSGTKWSKAKKCQAIPTEDDGQGGTRPADWAAWMPKPLR